MAAAPDQLAALDETLERFWGVAHHVLAHPPEREWYLEFATAVMEVANNIVRYAYPGRGGAGPLRLRLRWYADRCEAQVTDRGVPFVSPAEPALASASDESDDGDDLDILAIPEGGFGLALARVAVDQFDYHRTPGGRNRWHLVKRCAE